MCDLTSKIADPNDAHLSREQIGKVHLLEASAGTGKTYSIQTLYLRLVLVEGLTVQQILVVTFTRDATKELRDRLQNVLRGALDYLDGLVAIADDADRTKKIVDLAIRNGKDTARQRLQLALLDFDMAAIYTIHGFCQRALKRFAFETRQAFDIEPSVDNDDEIEQLCKDWWRKNLYGLDEKIAGFLSESGSFSLQAITTLARKLIGKPDAKLVPEIDGCDKVDDKLKNRLEEFLAQEPASCQETNEFSDALDEVKEPIQTIQDQIRAFRGHLCDEQWGSALTDLMAIIEINQEIEISCQGKATALVEACRAFKEEVPPRTQAKSFKLDDAGHLYSAKCSGLTPNHTTALENAAKNLNLPDQAKKYAPVSLAKKNVFQSSEMLCRHFLEEETCAAPQLFEAIKAIAKDGAGIAEKATITVNAINPAFRKLGTSLFAECRHAVCRAALEVKETYRTGRPAATTASFNDFLVDLRDALLNNGAQLKGVLRKEFRAALIDEFQDTDPVQWDIFENLFEDAKVPCFLVGDPKQAIYRFRNGDVETYLNATQSVDPEAKFPLNRNYRSEKRLIDAVNQIFLDIPDEAPTFGTGIAYATPLDAKGKKPEKSLLINGQVDETPFKIVLIDNAPEGGLPGKHSVPALRAYRLTAQEIAKVLTDKSLELAGRPVEKRDIAVLVTKHDEARYIAEELKNLNIPSVRQGTGNVWHTDEGKALRIALEAVLDPRNLSNVKRALLLPWCDATIADIRSLNNGGSIQRSLSGQDQAYRLEDLVGVFESLRETWIQRGFPAMFRAFSGVFALKKRLLSLPDRQGQRRLANIGHLSELVERTMAKDRKTPEGTLSWIRRQLDKETSDRGEDVELRLETDDDAVRIMTVFASKGLEFPIVFAPTLFMLKQQRRRSGLYEFHDQDGHLQIAVKTNDKKSDDHYKGEEHKEIDREHVRQIYVALTRAVHRTVVVALNDADSAGVMMGSLGRVLRLPMAEKRVDLARTSERFSQIENAPCAVQVEKDDGGYDIQALDVSGNNGIHEPPERPKPDTSKGHASFSSLAPHDRKKANGPVASAVTETETKDHDGGTAEQPVELPRQKPEGIFAFPAGARTGTCWHEIFEDLPFDADDNAIRQMAEQKLRIYGFMKDKAKQEGRIAVTAQMVRNVLGTPLPGLNGWEPFALSTVEDKDRKTEWEFSFATLSGQRTQAFRDAVAGHPDYKEFSDALGEWDREIPGGYLTGFVDLLFRKDGRYFIADWKSNRRNGTQEDFKPAGLKEEISLHRYWLQYLIYTVAVHQYLLKSCRNYKYAEHFGGVYYIFLRGVNGEKDDAGNVNGVYADRPPEALVKSLSAILGDFQ